MNSKNRAEREAWKLYDVWRKVGSYSPALKTTIRVSLMGWRHITGATGSKKRKFSDVYRRLMLLPYAREIIETSTTLQNITTKGDRKYYAIEAMIEVDELAKLPRKVRVILIEDKKGNKVFYSVMDKKRKSSGTPHA